MCESCPTGTNIPEAADLASPAPGRHYTPPALARRIVKACFDALPVGDGACRVLDPACGDGAFLREAFDELCARRTATHRKNLDARAVSPAELARHREIVRECLFGVDLDAQAVHKLRNELRDRLGADDSETAALVQANLRIGNAITGNDFRQARGRLLFETATEPTQPDAIVADGIDWASSFPGVAAAGGFDVVLGNPPYLREREAKALFEHIARCDLGRRWRQARMDLWYYFAHRGLDLLRPGGLLCLLVNSYWTAAHGASRLIERLRSETDFEEIELLGDVKLFAGVSGRHMVFRVRKHSASDGRIALADHRPACRVVVRSKMPGTRRSVHVANDAHASSHELLIPHADLFDGERLVLSPRDRLTVAAHRCIPLHATHNTRQGIAENPPRINRRLRRRFGDQYPLGAGVFVLTAEELAELRLSDGEQALVRPYYQTASLARYRLPSAPTHALLYLTTTTAPAIEAIPRIAEHLERFRPILEARREVVLGGCGWWHLHWPRVESIFEQPRVLSVQMGRRPQFVYARQPAYVGFSVNVVMSRSADSTAPQVLCGILNSELARNWFERHAKRRGVNLEINGHILKQFPLPERDGAIETQLTALVEDRQQVGDQEGKTLEDEIERLVERLYRLDAAGGNSQAMPHFISEAERTSSTL